MSNTEFYTDGFDELEKLLDEYGKKTSQENVLNVLEKGAAALVKDVMALPKPRSQIHKAGYTHLLDTMSYRRNRGEVEVGWGKYYGPMVERGTHRAPKGSPHVRPTFERNKKMYNDLMIKELFG
ncbi:HK97-gp10 family putative phage morphogenesis protein [Blautia producta]|uniref:HK97-gp10 family putative phage morphogenesis protein n=1 Tax=Blautia producta TaxID=33035 RepID=UPI0036F2F404